MMPLIIPFVAYLMVLFAIALYSNRRTRSIEDFVIGNRTISSPVAALSAGASDMSGWLLLGLPGAIYVFGLGEIWIVIGLVIGAWLNWTLVAKRLRVASVTWGDATSIPELLRLRVGAAGISLELVAALAIVIFFAIYVSAGFIACAKLFETVFGWNYSIALCCGVVIVMVYTSIGGFLAVSWTDTFQALLMLLVLIVVPLLAYSLSEETTAQTLSSGFFNIGTYSFLSIVGLLAWGLGYFGQPHILKRFMALKNPADVGKSRLIGMSWMIVASIGAIGVAYVGALVLPNLEDPELVLIKLSEIVLSPWIAGIVIAAILSAAMSTVDSQLLVISTSIMNFPLVNEEKALPMSRTAVIVVSVIAALLALDPNSQIFGTVSLAWAGIGASIGPPVLFALFSKNTTNESLISGILAGTLITFLWNFAGKLFPDSFFAEVYALLPAFIVSCIVITLVAHHTNNAESQERYSTFKIALTSHSTTHQ